MKRGGPLRPVSKKRAAQNRTYSALRRDFLAAWPRCQFPNGCDRPATDVHHKRGRVGDLLLDVTHWAALCRPHHRHVTEQPAESFASGISERRIGAA